jgi:hypothetical protein
VGVVLLLALLPAASAASVSGVSRATAAHDALRALKAERQKGAQLVLGLLHPLPAGTVISMGGPSGPSTSGRVTSSLERKVAVLHAPAWLFYQDLAPFQQYAHPGRVALVDVGTGAVSLTGKLDWPPLVNGALPAFFASERAYESTRYRVLYEPYVARGSDLAHEVSAVAALDPASATIVAQLLATEHACTVGFSDTVPGGYYAFAQVARSGAALANPFAQLSRLAAGLHASIYSPASGLSPTQYVARMVEREGCHDVLLYLAGGGYSAQNAVNIGLGTSRGRVLHQDVTLSQLRGLVKSEPGVNFELILDAPHMSGFRALSVLPNVLLVATPSGEGSFTYLPAVSENGALVKNTANPLHLLQLTDVAAFGIGQVIDSPLEIAQMQALEQSDQLPSALAYLLSRAFALGGPVDFAANSGTASPPDVQTHGFTAGAPGAPLPPGAPTVSANPDGYAATADAVLNVVAGNGVLANDTDSAGYPLAVDELNGAGGTPPLHGTSAMGAAVTLNADGSFTYDPTVSVTLQSLPSGQTATDAFTYRANDGHGATATSTVTITVSGSAHAAPVLSGIESGTLQYAAGAPATPITSALMISAPDDSTLAGATVSITSGFDAGADELQFTNQNGITGSYDASTGVLTLSGDATPADYQAALRSVEFSSSDGSTSPATRTVSFAVTDSLGATSASVSRAIDVSEANQPPVAGNVSYDAVGNTPLGVGTSPASPMVTINDTLLNHASDPDPGDSLTVTGNSSPAHGTVTVNSNGTFTYVPAAGYSGQDSFTYTVTDSDDPGNPKSATGTVTITVGPLVWYVNNSEASAGNGTSSSPFNTLAAANTAAGMNSIIFLYQGSGTYAGGVTMHSGEDLWGQPHGLTVDGDTLVSASGSAPTITNAGGDGIDLAQNSDVEGVTVSGPSGNGIAASDVNDATVGGASTGTAVSISGAHGDGIYISGGDGTIDFSQASVSGSSGHSVLVTGRTGGTATFGGSITDAEEGISLVSNSGATVNFTGRISASTGVNGAFSATGGGTVSATGTGSTLTTTTGTALSVQSVTIGSSGLSFQSISSDGANPGISLSGTGTSGGVTVTGTGAAGSGGTIQSSAGEGIELSSTSSPSFTDMVIKNNAADGIDGSQVSGLTLAGSSVSGNGTQSNVSGENDDGLDFSPNGTGSPDGLTGTVSITNTTVTGSADNNAIVSDTTGTLNLTVTGSTFSANNATTGNDGLHVDANGTTNATVSVTGSTFTNNFGDAFQFATDATSSGTNGVTFSNNSVDTTDSGVLGGGVVISPYGNSHTTLTADTNNIQNSVFTGIAIDEDGSTGTLSGTVDGNTIGAPGSSNSGSQGNDIGIFAEGSVTETLAIANNDLYQYEDEAGISFLDREGNPTMNLTITGNTIADPGSFGSWGLLGQSGAETGDSGRVCAAISGNSMRNSSQAGQGGADVELDQEFDTTINLPGYAGGAQNTNAVVSFVQGNNTGNGTPSGIATTSGSGAGFTGTGTTCP